MIENGYFLEAPSDWQSAVGLSVSGGGNGNMRERRGAGIPTVRPVGSSPTSPKRNRLNVEEVERLNELFFTNGY